MSELHWFAFAFSFGEAGQITTASVYLGFEDIQITVPRIDYAKERACINKGAVMIGLSYLGYMTRERMTGGDGEQP